MRNKIMCHKKSNLSDPILLFASSGFLVQSSVITSPTVFLFNV